MTQGHCTGLVTCIHLGLPNNAPVVKLVDTLDLGSSALRRGGSSPSRRTNYVNAGLLTVTDTTGVMSTTAARFDSLIDTKFVPFVYRLGRQVFNLKRGVRFPYGIPNKS